MEPQEITMGQVTYEVQRVFQGSRTVPEVIVDRLTQLNPARSAEAGPSGAELTHNFPMSPPVDGDAVHGL